MKSIYIILISVLIFTSCSLETAGPDYKSDLVIASNFLLPKDTIHYKGFEKRTGINIKILHLSADSIQKTLKSKGYNSKIDLVFLNSLSAVKDVETSFFHKFQYNIAKKEFSFYKPILENQWLVAGIDPFVFSYFQDSIERPTNYNQLTKGFLWATPNEENLNVFLAHIKYNLRKNKENGYREWKQNFKRNQVIYDEGTDSLASIQFLFSKESDIKSDPRLRKQKRRVISYPTGNSGCTFADRYCVALVDQSLNFYNAKRLLKYIQFYGRIPASFMIKPFPKKDKEGKCYFSMSESAILSVLKTNNN
ncbi:MAG: hypothetical protein ACOVQG_01950 [Crocinitomicaceae bacterium]